MTVAAEQPQAASGLRLAERSGLVLERNVFTVCVLAALSCVQTVTGRYAVIADSWYSLVSGRFIAKHGLPHHDTLTSLTQGRQWVDQQWLAHLVLYGLWQAGGWGLTATAAVLLYTGAFAVAAAGARTAGASDRSVALIVAACFCAGLPNATIRAQLFGYLLFAVVLALLLADARRPSRRVYLVFPLLVLWANVHGSVVLGAGLVALLGLTRLRSRRAWALILLPWVCVLVSPYGLALPGYYRSLLYNPTLAHSVSEWGPSSLRGQPVFFAVLLAGLWLATRWSSGLTRFAQLVLWVTALAGLLALRNQVWFALSAAAIVPLSLDTAWRPGTASRRRWLNVALTATLVIVAAVMIGRAAARGSGWYESSYPAAAAAAAADPGARIFATEQFADWLLFTHPELAGRVVYDVRYELLKRRQLTTIIDFRAEHGLDWQRAARGAGVLVLDRSGDSGAVRYFRSLPGTTVAWRDDHVIVLRLNPAFSDSSTPASTTG